MSCHHNYNGILRNHHCHLCLSYNYNYRSIFLRRDLLLALICRLVCSHPVSRSLWCRDTRQLPFLHTGYSNGRTPVDFT